MNSNTNKIKTFLLFLVICFFMSQSAAEAFLFQKKDYKANFLRDAISAEKRNNINQAFHIYEKAIYYYGKDRKLLESYARFCETHKYFDKAVTIYSKLYVLTKDNHYLYKENLCKIKNGKLSKNELSGIVKSQKWNQKQKIELNSALIYHFTYLNDWNSIKSTCDKLPKNAISKDLITTCVAANVKLGNKKDTIGYYLRYSDLNPKDSHIANRIISMEDELGNSKLAEKYIKKLIALNPKDNGIKYKLAGFYEKHGQWQKATKLYEALMASGDKNPHVISSYNYAKSQLNAPKKVKTEAKVATTPPKVFVYKPKPLSGFKLAEKNFYQAWKDKNYKSAQNYLGQMLDEQPKNQKLLRHKVDIDVSQDNYADAVKTFENLLTLKKATKEDEIFRAFLYSKTGDNAKALEIVETQLEKNPSEKSSLELALQYSLADKNWDKAIVYNGELLKFKPKSISLLKTGADLYSIKEDFKKAAEYYEKIVKYQPSIENKMNLANLYMADKNFSAADFVLEPLYNNYPDDEKITHAYLNVLLAEQKTYSAYEVIRNKKLLKTKEGYTVLGDLNVKNKMYSQAAKNYYNALEMKPDDTVIKNNLAFCYRMLGCPTGASSLYKEVLATDTDNKEARLGLGSLQIDKKNFRAARQIFNSILEKNPDYRPAKIATADSYIANDEKLKALDILDKLPDDDESKMMKAQVYYDFGMPAESKAEMKNVYNKDSEVLKYKIRKDGAITVTPQYSFFFQQLADEFNLDYQKYGVQVAQKKDNKNIFMEYNIYWFSSGSPYYLNNVTNEFKGGVQERVNPKWEYRADLGVKAFEFGNGAMVTTDSWIKHYFNDKFNLKLGIKRNNLEQSYLSAVGEYINGIFTGRVADTRVYLEYEGKLPHQVYTYGRGVLGFMYAQNLQTNPYFEGLLGIGKNIYYNPKNKWINTFATDLVTFNTGYQYNLLNLYSSTGQLYGGYFSPSYFNATTLQLKAEGEIKKIHLKYGVKGFGGIQTSMSPDSTTPTWGFSPYITYDMNDNISFNASYVHYTYADLMRDVFMINAVIRGFDRHAKK